MLFKEFEFKSFINNALAALKFQKPTDVQALVIPKALKGESLIVESATGSGKSHAFLLPIMQKINPNEQTVQALILAPTRELATELYQKAIQIASHHPSNSIDVRLAIGGTARDIEVKRFEKSQPHVVIGTIGRIQDLAITTNVLKIYTSKIVVIDEADMVLDEKDLLEVDKIIGIIPVKPQFLLFSATIPKGLRHFIHKYLEGVNPIVLEEEELTTKNIEHIMIPCKAKDKEEVLKQLLSIINPYLALIFVNKVEKVEELAKSLAELNYKVVALHGDLADRERKQTLKRIHDLQFQYVVASDIASRGIDIQGVSHVINFDLPNDVEFYIHRSGRTARHTNTGQAISLYDYDDERYVELLRKKGLKPKFMKIVGDALTPVKLRERKGKSVSRQIEDLAHTQIPVPKKVKPGYKKKRLEKIQKEIKKGKRAYIENLYRKRNKAQ